MPGVDMLLEQALLLTEKQRGELVARLLRSFESDEEEALEPDAWTAAWTDELGRRMREIQDGSATLVDGDAVFRAAEARSAARRR